MGVFMATAGATLARSSGAGEAFPFPKELIAFIDEWKVKPGSLIMMLHKIQETFGYIPRDAADQLAKLSGIPLARIYGVVTFYHFFKTTMPGKHRISVCLGTACYLKGGQDLIDEARSILSLPVDGVTPDGMFSIDPVRCVGCCGLAPVLTIDDDVYGKVTKDQLPDIIAKYQTK
jgi:NADH-quinone oxidoreductase subunit E